MADRVSSGADEIARVGLHMLSSPSSLAPPAWEGLPEPRCGHRDLFPDLGFDAYLAHAAISPLHLRSRAALDAIANDLAIGGAACFPTWDLQRQRLRRSLGALLGASETEIALTPGTTRGITDVALGIPWSVGDRLVTFRGEFPANITPWQRAAKAFGITVVLLEQPNPVSLDPVGEVLDQIQLELARGAKCVAVSAVQFQTGFAMPLTQIGELCRSAGAKLLVDAIQGCGVVPIDVGMMNVDALACGAHKWLLGLEGAGFLYLKGDFCQSLRPLTAGWLSHEEGDTFLFKGAGQLLPDRPLKNSAAVFEGSSLNAAGFSVLEAGLSICQELSPAAVFGHIQHYLDLMEPVWVERGFRSLRARTPASRSCILALEPPSHIALPELARALREQKVMVSTPDGYLRLAPHYANHEREVAVVEKALDVALAQARR